MKKNDKIFKIIKYTLILLVVATIGIYIYFFYKGYLMNYKIFVSRSINPNVNWINYIEYLIFQVFIGSAFGWITLIVLIFLLLLYSPSKFKKNVEKEKLLNLEDVSDEVFNKYNLDKDKLKKDLFNKYVDIIDNWVNENSYVLSEYIDKDLYNIYLEEKGISKLNNKKTIKKNLSLDDIKIISIEEKDNKLVINVDLKIELYKYVINKNDKVLRGFKDRKIKEELLLSFIVNNNNYILCKQTIVK